MPKITFLPNEDICPEGATIEVAKGTSICRAALDSGISIEHACELSCACTTCHVYVKDEWFDKVPAKEDGEEDMLDMAFEPKKNSRLSCQIIVSDELDGLTVNIPSKQS